tara:strand:+ start:263 stop:1198 length:936 start_codon:yes stop_codon:yes gene_type:complete
MADHPLRSALFKKDRQDCHNIVSSDLFGQSLIDVIYEMLFTGASVKYAGEQTLHPLCVINSIKNFIGDEREKPSRSLMIFGVDYLLEFELRNNDRDSLDDVMKNSLEETVFVGELEDACQNSDWQNAQLIMSKTFLASDRSRATLDTLSELALQNSPTTVIFVYHLLRSYQFQEKKNDNWTFINCIFDQIKFRGLEPAHSPTKVTPETIKDKVINSGDIVYYSAIKNIWNGDYVRSRGYRRELSYWLSKIDLEQTIKDKQGPRYLLTHKVEKSFTAYAKGIINNDSKTKNQKAKELVTLEAVRSILKTIDF